MKQMIFFLLICSSSASGQWDYLAVNAQTTNCCMVSVGLTGNNITTNFWGGPMTLDDDISSIQNIGFDFLYDGVIYNTFVISSNGFIKLGSTAPAADNYNVYSSGESNVIALLNMDLQPGSSPRISTRISTLLDGTKISQVEWTNMRDKNGIYSKITFQLAIIEASHEIQLRYFLSTATGVAGIIQPYIGIIGNSISNSVSVIKGTTDQWLNATYVDGPTTSTFSTNQIHVPLNQSNYRFRSTSFLPVILQSFEAIPNATSVKLSWSTEQEVNAEKFVIERSRDGSTFYPYDSVAAAGNTNVPNRYSAIDRSPLQGMSFYRLRTKDFDGRSTLSYVRTVRFAKIKSDIIIAPNPANDFIRIYSTENIPPEALLLVYDAASRRVMQIKINRYTEKVNISSLQPGIYLIVFSNGTIRTSKKFIKL